MRGLPCLVVCRVRAKWRMLAGLALPLLRPSALWPAPTRLLGTALLQVTSRATLTFLFSPFHLFLFLFVFSLFPLSPFCSRDAAKRKAWKLNRVGSLRNIYSSSSTNTEGNAVPAPPRPLSPRPSFQPPCLPAFLPSRCRNGDATRPKLHAPLLCLQSHSCGLSIFLFVCFIFPFMSLSAYLHFDLSLPVVE